MKTCQHCKHWIQVAGISDGRCPAGYGMCACPMIYYGYSCADDIEKSDTDRAVIENDEGWGMFTGPDFGCVHCKGVE